VVAELLKAAQHGGPFRFIARVAFTRALHGVIGVGPIPGAARRGRGLEGEASEEEAAMTKPMLDGRELSELDLAEIKRQIESYDTIDSVSDEMREIIAQHWPHLLAKIRPPKGH
jgi:hypothetical protein